MCRQGEQPLLDPREWLALPAVVDAEVGKLWRPTLLDLNGRGNAPLRTVVAQMSASPGPSFFNPYEDAERREGFRIRARSQGERELRPCRYGQPGRVPPNARWRESEADPAHRGYTRNAIV